MKKKGKTSISRIPLTFWASLAGLGLGTYWVLSHHSLWATLAGMALWANGIVQIVGRMAPVPGFPAFSRNDLRTWRPTREWKGPWPFLITLSILGLLGTAHHALIDRHWLLVSFCVLAAGGLLLLLQFHSPAFQVSPSTESSRQKKVPWREMSLFLVGAFFWFYDLDQWPNRFGGENLNTLLLAKDYMENKLTTPYVMNLDSYRWAPAFLLGLVFKVIGFSYLKALAIFAAINLAGVFFFYGSAKFFLTPNSAWMAALLYGTSYWVLLVGRQTFEGCSIITPFAIAALYFFLGALEKGRPRDFAIFGALLAFVLCNYLSSRFVLIFFLATSVILWVLYRKEMTRQRVPWALGWGVFALTYFPMALFIFQTQKSFHMAGNSDRVEGLNIIAWCSKTGHWELFQENIQQGLQMLTVRTTDDWLVWAPFLAPWEGIALLAGLGWCLWRLSKPPVLIALMGFAGGMSCAMISNLPTNANRALAGSPFVFLLIGIGLDRLGRAVGSPLRDKAQKAAPLFLGAMLFFSVLWHYDVYFRQLPASLRTVGGTGVPAFLAGKRLAQYPPGWDLYVTSDMNFPYEIYSGSTERMGTMNLFFPQWDLPLKKVPEKGAFLLLAEDLGGVYGEWMEHYYPGAKKSEIWDPFGNLQFRCWEITPQQVREGLNRTLPPGGIPMKWYDAKDRLLGRWILPSLVPGVQHWFDFQPGREAFPYGKTSYFKVKGWVRCPDGNPLALETNGEVDWTLGSKTLHVKGPGYHRLELRPGDKEWVPIEIRYQMPGQELLLNLSRSDPEGWKPVPSADWKP